ncbi:D-alanyl-D-alanine carboxypeptidase/D-alanyl-D-alanine-endopeptidase [Kushneria phosphatilytica]|uniref:D-alanyl-D-alanine carboxypeptidase/D-alanyl-D-alanine-endopeptidase n=2 Tax=Kushneria phosphatilytica TaxID=657387 RepID=A0A1S1NU27_9GAMM|nr:D-alanyl-D-alanine carboxypeptidase/D-alanyl-D-alanine-endopeptidase [Kushneria phosphatilytica]QEL12690.1 D-alanyl-D-alanine carboxypeptidase/D-alanyl-D-alanine-endopeptidase [Kushneria phosphatilytica]
MNLSFGQGGKRWLCWGALAALMGVATLSRAAGFPATAELAHEGFRVSAEARLLDSGETLGSLTPTNQLTPASVSKLYIAAAALDRWGPQKRFTTRLVTNGTVSGHTLQGDLILEGAGDPGLTSEDYWSLVQQLRQRDIERISGRVLVSQWRFGPVDCITTDRCRARERSRHAYDARLTSAAVDFATWCVRVMPGSRPGAEARVSGCFSAAPLPRVANHVKTVSSGKTGISAERVTADNGEDTLVLSGQIDSDTWPRTIYRSGSHPASQSAATFQQRLQEAGIALDGPVAVTNTPPADDARPLATVDGKPLQELLLRMLNYSNNFMADTLALDLADQQPAGLNDASAALEQFVARKVPDHGPVSLASGSGLTPQSSTSAHGLVALLTSMYRQPALFPVFVAGMQVPDNGPMHFIRRGSDLFQSHVMIKTGTLNEPVPVRAIAGYFRTESGRWGAFAVMFNGRAATPYLNWRKTLTAVSEDLTPMIENH